jgi:hypothetical protein
MPDKIDADLSPSKFRAVSRETTETVLAFFATSRPCKSFREEDHQRFRTSSTNPPPEKPQDPVKIIREVRRKIITNRPCSALQDTSAS